MLVRFVEIYEENTSFDSSKPSKQYLIREIYINKSHIISFKEDLEMINNFVQKKISKGFEKDQKFTLITVNKGNMGQDISVVGSIEYIYKLIEGLNGNKT